MIHKPSAHLIDLHRRLGDARLLRALGQFSVGQSADALEDIGSTASPASSMANRLENALLKAEVQILTILDPEYPVCFRRLDLDAPPLLYVQGDLGRLKCRSIAIIGTRRPTLTGRAAARDVAKAVSTAGWTVVSGNAPGVDSAAHESAISSGGDTLVCPPMPIDQYVPGFKCSNMAEVTVVSAFVPGAKVEPWMFLRRNSLVAAHCQVAFVAETGTRGGTLDTVRKLRRLRRNVFATALPIGARFANAHSMLAAGDGVELLEINDGDVWKSILLKQAEECLNHPPMQTPVLDDLFPEELTQ